MPDLLESLATQRRTDVSGLPPGALALLLARAALPEPTIVVVDDGATAARMAADLTFFVGATPEDQTLGQVLSYPAVETTPYLPVAPDRRAAMDRMAVLHHLATSLPWRFLVAPAPALLRRVPPRAAVASRSVVVRAEDEIDRDSLVRTMIEGGYLRVPVAEDPGTFAVRGSLLDVYPPEATHPARIELDDWLVLSIKLFDPDDQRTLRSVPAVHIHPVRDTLFGPDEIARARDGVRQLCDEVNLPTSRARQLVDDLASGRAFYGIEGFLPAFHAGLETLLDHAGPAARIVVLDPTAVGAAVRHELAHARADWEVTRQEGTPAFPPPAHYMDEEELGREIDARPVLVVHRLVVGGAAEAGEAEGSPLVVLETVDPERVLGLAGEDQSALVAEIKAQRSTRASTDSLAPLSARARAWLDAGLRVIFAARTHTQAERLVSLLRGHDLPVRTKAWTTGELPDRKLREEVEVVVGGLRSGFVLATEALCFVTEEEIFGERSHRTGEGRRRERARPFLEDLRELRVGDYVVHVDHGVGRYLGLEHKKIGQSQLERMLGHDPHAVEVLVLEYGGGDRLYLPVTRLNQIEKLSGKEGAQPKLDRLGGRTFDRTKARVRQQVQRIADELLRLYAQRAASTRAPLSGAGREYAELEASFAFEETPDQARAIEDVLGDLLRDRPMDRVVCGDVGFGKTEVALRAAFRVGMTGKQVALLCPTTVLAQQHFLTFRDRLQEYPLRVAVLSRFVQRTDQAAVLAGLKDGSVDVVIGTHRLLSKDVHFKSLGLLVVDEEQRFGVTHKERIKRLRAEVDVLTLSATPIPRTLQMAIGGLRDLSLITTAPVDRRAVRTFVSRWDDQVIREAIRREVSRGGQVFFVHNRIEGLYERATRVQQLVPEARVAVAHGQMKESSLERVMTDFVEGRYDVLCSTAIIESGLDIPRANTILIDRADIFGLAQLYQLRGRVGRAKERAYCYLLTPPPSAMTDDARYRIEALERFTELASGFHVASLDMELRGAGDLLGVEQSGTVSAIGFDLFLRMLEEAIAQMRGEPVVHDVDTELTFDVEHHLPEEYIDDVGLRLSFYKRFASAPTEDDVRDLAVEMEDRFGRPPSSATRLVRVMALKPALRDLRALGCEATSTRVTLHLREDTPLDPAKVLELVGQPRSPYKLTPDMKLTRRFVAAEGADAIARVEQLLSDLGPLRRNSGDR